jgi:hypothetical protein
MITLEEIKSTALYKRNASLYDTVIDTYKGISNHKDGFCVYFYEQEQVDYSSHEEFKFYTNKLERINKSIKDFMSINIDKKLSTGIKDLTNLTETLLNNSELKAYDLNSYRSEVSQIQNSMCNDELLSIINGLKIEISDLNRNLPKIPKPLITNKLIVSGHSNNSINELFSMDLPIELKGPPMMNGFIFPLEVYNEQCILWTGDKPAPLIGTGTKELWKLRDNKWQMTQSKITWVS